MGLTVMKHLVAVLFLGSLLWAGCSSGSDRQAPSITEMKRRALDPRAGRWLREAQQAYRGGSYGGALAMADSAAKYAPDLADVPFLRGLIFTRLYRIEAAQAAFEAVLALDPAYRAAAFNLGNNAFLLGMTREALRHYRREQRLYAGRPETAAGSHADAERAAMAMIALQIGRVYARLGIADSARLAYEQALALDSSKAQTYLWLAELYEDEGAFDQALSYARRALALKPDEVENQYLVGALCYRTGAVEEAVGYLEAVLKREPWHAGANYNLGRALMALGHVEEARALLEKTDELQQLQSDIRLAQFAAYRNPDDPEYLRVLAGLLDRAGRRDEAREAYRVWRQSTR